MIADLKPFAVTVAQEVIDDLHARLDRTRFPATPGADGWRDGTSTAYLRELLEYWRHHFDWRTQQARINRLAHYRVEIDSVPVHFVHRPGVGPRPLPLILTHGWPWTFWDFAPVIDPLADPAAHTGDPSDSFDVIVPSLPGFCFSSPLTRAGITWHHTADIWLRLMRDVLGYQRFVAFGGDLGNAVTLQLGHKYPEHVAGIHFLNGNIRLDSWNTDRPWDLLGPPPAGLDPDSRRQILDWQRRFASHLAVNVLDPHTFGHALDDSPAGLCSWLIERRRAWSDCNGDVERRFSRDELLTTVMLYWITGTAGSAAHFYAEAARHPWTPSRPAVGGRQVDVPTSVSAFAYDVPQRPTRERLAVRYRLHQLRVHERGGHFAPMEEPETLVADIRDGFRHLRT